jgi:hypothetical protein
MTFSPTKALPENGAIYLNNVPRPASNKEKCPLNSAGIFL